MSDEVRHMAAEVPNGPMLRQEAQSDRFSGWRNLPRRAVRVLRRCRAMFRVPDELDQLRGFIDQRHAASSADLRDLHTEFSRLHEQFSRLHEQLRRLADNQQTAFGTTQTNLEQLTGEVSTGLAGIRARFGPEAISELQREVSAEIAFSLNDVAQRLLGQHGGTPIEKMTGDGTARLENIENHLDRLANEQFEAKNHLIHVGTNTESLLENLTTIAREIRNAATHLDTSLHSRLNTLEYERLDGLYEQMHHLTAALLRLRADVETGRTERSGLPAEQYAPARPGDPEADLQRAQGEFPRVFPMWAERLEEMRQACLETKVGNVAHAGDPRSEAFRSLVEIHAVGRVLDVGCGVFGRPFYLSSYPAPLISGLDPLEPSEPVDFEFVRGIQEYLPWPDKAFSTVISATALDHCLSLDRSLAEIRRVLCPGGRFLL